MFSNSESNTSGSAWKNKSHEFRRASTHHTIQNNLQSLRYLNFSELIDWCVNLPTFQTKVSSIFNYYTLLNTLFAISEEVDWRSYIGHMNVLISTFHNIMCSKNGSSLQDINKIDQFSIKFERLFLLKDLTIHKHLMLLLKVLLAFNPKYSFLKETTFSLILVESATYNDLETIRQIVWILAQIEVSPEAFVKLIKHEGLNLAIQKGDISILPLLTIIATFLANPDQDHNIIQHLIISNNFQKIFQLGLSSTRSEIVNQTILVFNNAICFSPTIREILLKNPNTLTRIMSFQCPEKQKLNEILTLFQFQKQLGCSNLPFNLINSNLMM